jgi:O-glycosyl hydrolase
MYRIKRTITCFLFLIVAIFCNVVIAKSLTPVNSKSEPKILKWDEITSFDRSQQTEKAEIWGLGKQHKGVYPKEDLPSCFSRKIVFDELNFGGGELKWIFTGKSGGITILINQDSVVLMQRFYDSFGLNYQFKSNNNQIPRFPEVCWKKDVIHFNTEIKEMVISMSHNLELKLSLNGQVVALQECVIDVDRNQLTFSGEKGVFKGTLYKPAIQEAIVNVDIDNRKQQMLGFGAITSIIAYNELSTEGKKMWWKYITDYNLLIQREYPIGQLLKPDFSNWDNKDDAVIHYYGDNYPNGEISDFTYNKHIQELGGKVLFEFWKLPDWMYSMQKDASGKEKKVLDYEKYATAIVNYCQTAKEKTGKAPEIVGIQNEVTQNADVWNNMTLTLRKKLNEVGFVNVKIHSHNSNSLSGGISAMKAFKSKQEMWKAIDFTATNMYDYQNYFDDPDGIDSKMLEWQNVIDKKPFISTEICVNDSKYQNLSYRIAFLMAELYQKNLTLMNATAIVYCWGLLNGPHPTFDGTRSLFRINRNQNSMPEPSSFQLRVFGAFSRHIYEGMERVETQCDNSDLLVSAFKDEKRKSIILLNRSTNIISVSINWEKEQFKSAEITDQFNENRAVELLSIMTKNILTINPGQIITIY